MRIPSPTQRRSSQVSRREFLRIGGLAGTSLALPDLLQTRALGTSQRARRPSAGGSFGKAKSCIVLFMLGGPCQLETWDPKPDAPAEIRGEFTAIDTNVRGIRICQYLPRLAQLADKYTLIRSMAHRNYAHFPAAHTALTGTPHPQEGPVDEPASVKDSPALGSVLARLRPTGKGRPPFVMLPDFMSAFNRAPGQDAGWLGRSFDPLVIRADPNDPSFTGGDLVRPRLTRDELARRCDLLSDLAPAVPWAHAAAPRAMDQFYAKAFQMLSETTLARALDLGQEPGKVRDCYGRTTFGQSCLLARRLVEAGVGLVTVAFATSFGPRLHWDTHAALEQTWRDRPVNVLKNKLLPITDQAVAALLADLSVRGLLEETLVVCMGEFGRTPKVSANGGRDHWNNCYSIALAGGGVAGGNLHGASDRIAAYPVTAPVSPSDVGATLLHALGVDPGSELRDPQGRPLTVSAGQPLLKLLQ
jgi:hypothetical protein